MGNPIKLQRVTRRTLLIVAGATSLLGLMSESAEAKMAQTAVRYQNSPKDSKQCDGCKLFHLAKWVQICSRRHLTERVVCAVGKEVTSS